MFNRKTISIFTGLLLLISSCGNQSRKYDLVGIWYLDCHYLNNNSKYQLKTAYTSDGTFDTQVTSKFFFTFNSSLSGTYKIDGNKLKETITFVSKNRDNIPLPQTQVRNLDWIDADSFMAITGNIDKRKCLASRAS